MRTSFSHFFSSNLSRLFLLLCLFGLGANGAFASQPLSSVFSNMPGADWQAVKDSAASQAAGAPFYKSNAVENMVFEGCFKPSDNTTKLAIFSDDGVDVYINGSKVHSKKGTGQHLPAIDQSLHQIGGSFDPTRSYRIKIDYSNTGLTSDTDIDGITLFCFGGGGNIVTGGGEYKHDQWIAGKITWSYDEASQSQQPSASDATEVCKWSDDCGGTTKPDEQHKISYIKTGDETLKPNPDDKKTWIRRVTFRAPSKCGGLNSTLVDEKNYCACYQKDMPGSVPPGSAGSASASTSSTRSQMGAQSRVGTMALPAAAAAAIKWVAFKGGKKAAVAAFKKLVKEGIKARVRNSLAPKFLSRSAGKQFLREADDLLSILDNNSWYEWLIDCVPFAQEGQFALKLKEAYDKAKLLQKRVDDAIAIGKRIQAIRKQLLARISGIINQHTGPIRQRFDDAKFGIRGSLVTGEKGPHKGYALFDPNDYDVDAYIVSDKLAALIPPNRNGFRSGGRLPDIANVQATIQQLLQSIPGYRGQFTFRVFSTAEFARLNPKGIFIG